MKKRALKRRYGHGARRDAKDELYEVGATHAAFGDEGMREYRGTRLGAVREANRIARRGGHGWRPVVRLLAGMHMTMFLDRARHEGVPVRKETW